MTAQKHTLDLGEDVRSYLMDFEQIGLRDLGRVGVVTTLRIAAAESRSPSRGTG
jgi:hypothetical protein